ncbi:MAG: type II secretion system protein GspC [Myxococcota bacterium]
MIEQLFRRRFWVFHVVFLAIAASIVAACMSSVTAYVLRRSLPDAPASSPAVFLPPTTETRDFDIANERNLFKARREVVEEVQPDELEQKFAEDKNRSLSRWQDAVESKLPVKLVGTTVFAHPHFSLASIVPNAKKDEESLYSINACEIAYLFPCNRLLESAEVVRIEVTRVYLYNEKERRYEYLEIDMASQFSKRVEGPMRQPIQKKSAAADDGEIREVADGSYEIDQGHLDGVLNDLAQVAMDARAVPYIEGGKQAGFKIFSIRPGSIFDKIGLKNGDILVSVNGNRLDNLTVAMGLLEQLRRKKHFTVDVKRGGATRTLDYAVK